MHDVPVAGGAAQGRAQLLDRVRLGLDLGLGGGRLGPGLGDERLGFEGLDRGLLGLGAVGLDLGGGGGRLDARVSLDAGLGRLGLGGGRLGGSLLLERELGRVGGAV